MTFKNPSGVHQLSVSAPGVGDVTLAAGPASPDRVTFDAAVGSGNTCFYGLHAVTGNDGIEWGIGTVTTSGGVTTLTRDVVIENTNGTTSKINFSTLTDVWVDVPGVRDVFINAAGDTVELPNDVAISFSGTGAATTRTNLGVGNPAFSDITGVPSDNTALGSALNGKQAASSNLTDFASKTAPTGAVVGTTDTQTLSAKTLGNTKEATYTITDGAAFSIDPANGGLQQVTLGASRSPVATSFVSGQSMGLKVAGTTYAITWPSVVWNGGTAPTLSTTGWTHIELWKDGDALYGALVGVTA